jgi:predicted dehydrogenase
MHEGSLRVVAYGFTSPLLQSIGETEIVDELRVIVHDGTTSAYFTFSSQMRPSLHHFRMYGPKNGLVVDEQQQTVTKVRGKRYKSYLEQFLPPLAFAKQYVADSLGNMRKFLRADFQADYGMKYLIRSFYDSIVNGGAVPIPYREILLTARIMDEIFSQLFTTQKAQRADFVAQELLQHQH